MTGYEIIEYVRDNLDKSNIEILKELKITISKTSTVDEIIESLIQNINTLLLDEIIELFDLVKESKNKKKFYSLIIHNFNFAYALPSTLIINRLSIVKIYKKDKQKLMFKIIQSNTILPITRIGLLKKLGCSDICLIRSIFTTNEYYYSLLNMVSTDKDFKHKVLIFLHDNLLVTIYNELYKDEYFKDIGIKGIKNGMFIKHCDIINKIRYYFNI